MAINLAIFDIDGTLTETNHVDETCFMQALADAHGITEIDTDWATHPHTTDSAITSHIFQTRFRRFPDEAELLKFKTHFVRLLEDYRAQDSSFFKEIAGASSMLRQLNREPEWRVAIASGSWRDPAMLKLQTADIDANDYPAAFADDGFSREEIVQAAVMKARAFYRQNDFAKIVSVGDGLWDVRTARNLKFSFLGIGIGEAGVELYRAGATHVIKDFSNYSRLLDCLGESGMPNPESDMN